MLRGFHARGISSGNTADAIQEYVATAEALKNYVADSTEVLGQTLREYLNAVDEADRYLYFRNRQRAAAWSRRSWSRFGRSTKNCI